MNTIISPIHPHTSQDPLIRTNIPLQDKNWFKTGGNAQFFAEPRTIAEFQAALQCAQGHKLALFMLGQGANILVSNEGFKGLVIRPQLTEITVQEICSDQVLITAGAGATVDEVIAWCLDHHLIGLEEFSGIPGTIGGSVFINLHYYDFMLSDFIVQGTVIDKMGIVQTVQPEWFNFGYDHTILHNEEHYVVSATFKLKKVSPMEIAYARGRRAEIIRHRAKRYPTQNTCGSFFRNFHDHEVTMTIGGKKIIYAAYYLDKVGIKGALSVGDAHVSHQHANMIINGGSATSVDIMSVARLMQHRVQEEFGLILQPECRLVGFESYPLL